MWYVITFDVILGHVTRINGNGEHNTGLHGADTWRKVVENILLCLR